MGVTAGVFDLVPLRGVLDVLIACASAHIRCSRATFCRKCVLFCFKWR